MTEQEFLNSVILQNCGDSLKIIEKTNIKNKNGNYLWKCEFQKYKYEIFSVKREVENGRVLNPLIEKIEFIDKIWPQNCGDSLKVIRKTDKKDTQNHHFLYEVAFQKYSYICFSSKQNIIKGTVNNPKIEEIEFVNKTWPQHCGDSLRIIKKTTIKNSSNEYFWECEFQKYKYRLNKTKSCIKKGHVLNPLLIDSDIINKNFTQKNGDILKVLKKIKDDGQNSLFECIFINTNNKKICKKGEIKRGGYSDEKKYIWRDKTSLENYIKNNFSKNPSLKELSKSLYISDTLIGQLINKFELRNYINYYQGEEEKELYEFIKSIYKKKILINKSILGNKEIDIYLPDLKLGFEFNGNYWHSNVEKFGVSNNYHQEKTLLAKNKDIQLFHIFEYEWLEKQSIIKSWIKSKFGIFDKKIGARKCKIKEIKDYKEYANFCNENHIQGECGAKVKLGLYFKDELVQVMSFGVPRFTDKYEWEILRECSKLGFFILGGKEKLWKYFVEKYIPKSVISYCDFSKFNGNSYIKIGFKLDRLNKSGFMWYDIKRNYVFWRNPYKNQEIKKENFNKIYDCGQLVFSWYFNKF